MQRKKKLGWIGGGWRKCFSFKKIKNKKKGWWGVFTFNASIITWIFPIGKTIEFKF